MKTLGTVAEYQGSELTVFADAVNWKHYWSSKLRPFIGETVIEVGAGLGGSTAFLCNGGQRRWLCLDPDPTHALRLKQKIEDGEFAPICEAVCGVLSDLEQQMFADTIIYIDVLEHIENDVDEMRQAVARLKPGGHVLVLAPAFNCLFSDFDSAVGHYRRYVRKDVGRLTLPPLSTREVFYLDSVGFFVALANRFLLKKAAPSQADIRLWDRMLVPVSKLTDKFLGSLFGKTIVMIWQKG